MSSNKEKVKTTDEDVAAEKASEASESKSSEETPSTSAETMAAKGVLGVKKRVDKMMGQTIAGRYTVTGKIGAGGMGVVYKAKQGAVDRDVAIKMLLQDLVDDESLVQRFHLEAKAASALVHPNSITVYDFGQHDDMLYIAMEFLEGVSLAQALRQGPMPPGRAIKIMIQALGSLHEAHTKGIIHRDLKPDNIFLTIVGTEVDFVKVLDFGVAKLAGQASKTLTKAGMIFGTPAYMSPEQARCQKLDSRSDLYALGVIMYEMLVGQCPFDADEPVGLLLKHVTEKPKPFSEVRPDLQVPKQLEALVMRTLAKEADERFKDAADMQAALEQVAHDAQIPFGTTVLPMMRTSANPISPTPVPGQGPDTGQTLNTDQAADLLGIGARIEEGTQDTVMGTLGADGVLSSEPMTEAEARESGGKWSQNFGATLQDERPIARPAETGVSTGLIAAGVGVAVLLVIAIVAVVMLTGEKDVPTPDKPTNAAVATPDKPQDTPPVVPPVVADEDASAENVADAADAADATVAAVDPDAAKVEVADAAADKPDVEAIADKADAAVKPAAAVEPAPTAEKAPPAVKKPVRKDTRKPDTSAQDRMDALLKAAADRKKADAAKEEPKPTPVKPKPKPKPTGDLPEDIYDQ